MKRKRFFAIFLALLLGASFFLFKSKTSPLTCLPVIFAMAHNRPLLLSKIQGKNYVLLVDSGSAIYLSLAEKVLKGLQKENMEQAVATFDFRGNEYTSSSYRIPEIKVGLLHLSNCEAKEDKIEFNENTTFWNNKRKTKSLDQHGTIGWPFFERYCAFFDFPSSSIYLAKNLKELKCKGIFDKRKYLAIPFTIQQGLITVLIETELGKHKVILDTGTAVCALRINQIPDNRKIPLSTEHSYFHSNKMMIGGCDFKDWDFALLDVTNKIEADGWLGMDFFLEHAICFDFANQIAYIKKPEGLLGTQWRRGKYHLTQFFLRHFYPLPKLEDL